MASFSIDYTDTTVKIKVSGITSGQEIRFYVREDPDPGYAEYDEIYDSSGTSMTKTVSGLEPDTDYACNVNVAGTWIGTKYFTTEKPSIEIDKWSWNYSNGAATASQTKSAYNAVSNKGYTDDFSYLVWNDMVDKVIEILDATGGSWYSGYLSYSKTLMSSSDKILTADRFNSLRFNIGSHHSTGIQDVYTGDIIYGSYFLTLAECINAWIDKIN